MTTLLPKEWLEMCSSPKNSSRNKNLFRPRAGKRARAQRGSIQSARGAQQSNESNGRKQQTASKTGMKLHGKFVSHELNGSETTADGSSFKSPGEQEGPSASGNNEEQECWDATSDEERPTTSYESDDVFKLLVDLAQALLGWSWEGSFEIKSRVKSVAKTYDKEIEILVGVEAVILQMDGRQALLSSFPGFPPLAALPKLKEWFLAVADHKLTPVEAREKFHDVTSTADVIPWYLRIFGVMVLGFAFAIDIVGTWEGCIVGLVTGILAGIVFVWADRSLAAGLVAPFLAAFIVSVPVMLLYKYGVVTESPGLLLVPPLFVFIPGDSVCMQAVELMDGHWVAGVARLFYSIVVLVLLAVGAWFGAAVTGTSNALVAPGDTYGYFQWWALYPSHVLFTIGVALCFQMRWKQDIILATCATLITTVVSQGFTALFSEQTGTLVGSVVMVVVSCFIARKPYRSPAFVFILTPFFTLTPGSQGLRGYESLIGGQDVVGVEDFQSFVTTIILISIGMIAGFVISPKKWWRTPDDKVHADSTS